jgi:hypothetical protein
MGDEDRDEFNALAITALYYDLLRAWKYESRPEALQRFIVALA